MSRTPKILGDEEAREVTVYLLRKGIAQVLIAQTVGRSQSWVAGIKKELDIRIAALMEGQQIAKDEILEKTAQHLANQIIDSASGNYPPKPILINPLIKPNTKYDRLT